MKTVNKTSKYKNTLGFVDLLFNLLIGFVFLFLLAFILINPVAKKDTFEPKAEYLIVLTWNDRSRNDIDLWIKDDADNIVSFKGKDIALMNLDRDDLGQRNDTLDTSVDNKPRESKEEIFVNREVISIRSKSDRSFSVTTHYYSGYGIEEDVTVEIIQVNPYKILKVKKFNLEEKGVEKFVASFDVRNGNVIFTDNETRIATSKQSYMKYGAP